MKTYERIMDFIFLDQIANIKPCDACSCKTHLSCIEKWIQISKKCPTYREPLFLIH